MDVNPRRASVNGTMRTILWWLIAGSKGGVNRARIIMALHDRPFNAHQLSERVGLDYKTVRHHLRLLSENGIVESNTGERYGAMYFLSNNMEGSYDLFTDIWNKIKDKSDEEKSEE